MNDAIHQVSQLVGEIAAAAVEQSQGIMQVQQAVNQMDDVTQQNAALVEQAAAASQSLQEQAGNLNQLVGKFHVSDAIDVPQPIVRTPSRPKPQRLAVVNDADWQSF